MLMSKVFNGCDFIFTFFDDSLCFSKTKSDHLRQLRETFERFRAAGLTLRGSKCKIAVPEVTFLGTRYSKDGAQPSQEKLEAIQQWREPRSAKEVRQFIGLCNQYRRHVANFAAIAAPLHHLTGKGVPFDWTSECQTAFDELKRCLISPPILVNPDFTKEFSVFTDASGSGVGAILKQGEAVIEFSSRAFNSAEKKYSATEKECLAILHAFKVFRHYLLGKHFTVHTDHCPLTYIDSQRVDSYGRLGRWRLLLQEFDFTVKYRRGVENSDADALSRLHGQEVAATQLTPEIDTEELKTAQRHDPELSQVIQAMDKDAEIAPRWRAGPLQQLGRIWKKLKLDDDGVLLRKFNDPDGLREVPVVPARLRQQFLTNAHEGLGGHFGAEKCYRTLKLTAYWPGMAEDIVQHCQSCSVCQEKKAGSRTSAPLGELPIGSPWDSVAIDIVKVAPSSRGNKYLLVAQDQFSKYLTAVAIPDQTAETTARAFLSICSQPGLPRVIHSDQGPNFESQLFQDTLRGLGVTKTRTTAYNPKGNGLAESGNKSVLQLLRCFTERESEWEDKLPLILLSYNSRVHCSTQLPPLKVFTGRDPSLPVISQQSRRFYDVRTYADKLEGDLLRIREFVEEHLVQAAGEQKSGYDRSTGQLRMFSPGDEVLLRIELAPYWEPGWQVLSQRDLVVEIQKIENGRTRRVSVNRLRPRILPVPDGERFLQPPFAHAAHGGDEADEEPPPRRYPVRRRMPVDRYVAG
ncbi:hypothetical protein BOX15_Mlig009944g1 [Macrostomum lignano]|uniref:Integrase catalytic domain-containing protein n=1 Tax=Macrostomum lignano TaxID=282301 RepID=A0A267EDL0_9PLAT|nr:hypothetical protein BOX15_Mlig009944g1 [Macrostomum lignano]